MTAAAPTPRSVTVRVPAKVNLELRVGPPRADGFHELATVFHAVDLVDEVSVAPWNDWQVVPAGRYADEIPTDESNLALRAARLLAERHPEQASPVSIQIDKSIPVAGGMAGGSADAAGALVACDALWGLGCERDELAALGAELGSDVPFALMGGTALGTGRGEQLAPVLARGTFHWVFATSNDGLSTPAVYAECDRLRGSAPVPEPTASADLMAALRAGDPEALGAALGNDLQAAAVSLKPELEAILLAGRDGGALGWLVSGSGPTVAFLVRDREAALDLCVTLAALNLADDLHRASGPAPGAHVIAR